MANENSYYESAHHAVPELGVYKLHESAKTPKRATLGSACFDICLCLNHAETITRVDAYNNKSNKPIAPGTRHRLFIEPGERVLAPTGIIFCIPDGYSLRLHSRSSFALREGLRLGNSEGIIDQDYHDETFVMLHNTSNVAVGVDNGNRICQAELAPVVGLRITERSGKPIQTTDRTGGFGSTGK